MELLVKKFGKWNVRIIRTGENYNNSLVNDGKPLVAFYDSEFPSFGSFGQQVSTYYKETVESHTAGYPLCLYGKCPKWTVSADEMKEIVSWLKSN